MKNLIFWISVFLLLVFWPTSFFLANRQDWYIYSLYSFVVVISWFLFAKNFKYFYFVFLALPILNPIFLFVPVFSILFYIKDISLRDFLVYGSVLIAILLFSWSSFFTNSIFIPDPLRTDTLNKKISLIPNRSVARVFENKTTPPVEKYKTNLFESLDFNNYFFAFHPRELGSGQNLTKFSFLAVVPFLLGLYGILENIYKKWLLSSITTFILALSLINNQDKYESILYFPLILICFYGLIKIFNKNNFYSKAYSVLFISVSILEFIRVLSPK